MSKIHSITALEILDSRGNPTVMVNVALNNGITASACVPSGASTGIREAVELRDGNARRYGGKGVFKAVANVNKIIGLKLKGKSPQAQQEIDALMCKLDGTENKSKLGGNAILGVSMAVCRAAALDAGLPLYALHPQAAWRQIRRALRSASADDERPKRWRARHEQRGLPGVHAVPHRRRTFAKALRCGAETFHTLKKLLQKRGLVTSVGDEGGFAPNLKTNTEAVDVIVEAIKAAGYKPGKDLALALDPAASEFYDNGSYVMKKSDRSRKTPTEMVTL